MQSAIDFLEKAEQCRRLAASIGRTSDPAAVSLEAMAVEFETKADALIAGPVKIDLPLRPRPSKLRVTEAIEADG